MGKGKSNAKRNAPGKGRKRVGKQKNLDDDDEVPKKVVKRAAKVQFKEAIDDFEPSDSDDDLGKADKILLDNSRRTKGDDESEEEVLGVHSSSDDDDDGGEKFYGGGVESDMDSDIEGLEKDDNDEEVDNRAWGSNTKNYYDTDYVDKDFGGMRKEEEELAELEEEEAKKIQKRLFAHLESTDFTMGMLDYVEEKKAELKGKKGTYVEEEKIKTDLSGLSKEEKIRLLKQDSPIAFKIIEDFKKCMELAQNVLKPILNLVKDNKFPKCPASDFVHTYYGLVLNYCTNIVFYFVHRSSEGNNDSPVIQRLMTYRKVIDEMDVVMESQLLQSLQEVLKKAKDNELVPAQKSKKTIELKGNRAQRRKQKLQIILDKKLAAKEAKKNKKRLLAPPGKKVEEKLSSESEDEVPQTHEEIEQDDLVEEAKRGITFEMRKNKGLTPRRKKENRNPRVKNKNKYRKALIRRKGQVREVRTEVSRYGGEVSGIKAYTSKSVKFKN